MANVHGIRDVNNANNRNNNQNNVGDNYQRMNQVNDKIPFINTMRSDRQPMDQTIPYTLKTICCPDIKPCSSTVVFLAMIWAMYVLCLTQGIQTKNFQVLEIPTNVLVNLGAAQGILIQAGQVYRLITAAFLHVNLMHILMNSISLLFIVSRFEKIYPKQTPIVLIVSSISGFILSVLCDKNSITVGSSTAIFGVLGGLVAYLVINWRALENYGPVRQTITCIIVVLVVISLLFSIGPSIDGIAHVGGLIAGIMISLAILPGIQEKHKMLTIVGSLGIVVLNLITLSLLFVL